MPFRFVAGGCAYLGLQVKAMNCISPCLHPAPVGFNPLPTVITWPVCLEGEAGQTLGSWSPAPGDGAP
jgi:hypothetical protein